MDGVKFHHCSNYHWVQAEYEAPAFQYVMYAQAIEKMMKKGIHHAAAMYGSQEESPRSWTASSQSSVSDFILVPEIQEEPKIEYTQKPEAHVPTGVEHDPSATGTAPTAWPQPTGPPWPQPTGQPQSFGQQTTGPPRPTPTPIPQAEQLTINCTPQASREKTVGVKWDQVG